MQRKDLPCLFWIFVILLGISLDSSLAFSITDVTTSAPFFNPSLNQSVRISFKVDTSGFLNLWAVDRDGYLVRKVAAEKVTSGVHNYVWDGRDDQGEIVPDEAYTFRIDLDLNGKTETYFPADSIAETFSIREARYNRQEGILSYRLARASRVHIQGAVIHIDPVTKNPTGPVLKTIANRDPRPAGAVIEHWNGMDESDTIFVPDLKNFGVAIAATPLPENSVITIGNRSKTFLQNALQRNGDSLFNVSTEEHHHHQGLATLDDVSPALKLNIKGAIWDLADQSWKVRGKTVQISGAIEGVSAGSFSRQPASMAFFIDGECVSQILHPVSPFSATIPIDKLASGVHVVAVNWGSDFGPVTVNSFRLRVGTRKRITSSNLR